MYTNENQFLVRQVGPAPQLARCPPWMQFLMPVNAAVQCVEVGEGAVGGGINMADGSTPFFYNSLPQTAAVVMGVDGAPNLIRSATGPLVGIQLGHHENFPFEAGPLNGLAQLRLNMKTGNGNYGRYELVSAKGDGTAPAIVSTLVEPVRIDHVGTDGMYDRLELIVDVQGNRVQGYVNGVLIAEITNPAKIPDFTFWASSPSGFMTFFYCSTNVIEKLNGWWGFMERYMDFAGPKAS